MHTYIPLGFVFTFGAMIKDVGYVGRCRSVACADGDGRGAGDLIMSECMIMIPQLGYGLAATLNGSGRDRG